MVLGTMSESAIYIAIYLTQGYNYIIIRDNDILLTAVITPIGML